MYSLSHFVGISLLFQPLQIILDYDSIIYWVVCTILCHTSIGFPGHPHPHASH